MMHEGASLDVVRGTLLDTGKQAAFYPGALPEDPAHLLSPAKAGAEKWLDADYEIMRFAPAPLTLRPGDGPPHIRLDRAAEFLIGDRLLTLSRSGSRARLMRASWPIFWEPRMRNWSGCHGSIPRQRRSCSSGR
jgi:hypothetical protein